MFTILAEARLQKHWERYSPGVVVTMGCNVRCPFLPCSRREDWGLEDPTGSTDEKFIEIINKIEERIIELKDRLSD